MIKYLYLILIFTLTGCTEFLQIKTLTEGEEEPTVETSQPIEAKKDPAYQLQPVRSVEQLLVQRLSVCGVAKDQRETYIKKFTVQPNPQNGVNEEQLNQLLLASCSPETKPGVLNQLLADLTSAGTWPEGYAAFFDLVISGQRAYAAVEKVYLGLKQEHEKTIQGLSEIETQIEKQSAVTQPLE